MTSIGRRLGISLFVSLLLAGLLISQGALWWLEREQRDSLSASLRDDAAGVLTAIGRDRNDVLTLDPTRLHPAYRRPLSGRYFVVLVGHCGMPRCPCRSPPAWTRCCSPGRAVSSYCVTAVNTG